MNSSVSGNEKVTLVSSSVRGNEKLRVVSPVCHSFAHVAQTRRPAPAQTVSRPARNDRPALIQSVGLAKARRVRQQSVKKEVMWGSGDSTSSSSDMVIMREWWLGCDSVQCCPGMALRRRLEKEGRIAKGASAE